MYKASCLCKKVSLVIKGAITDIIHCHCSLCRKSSGTAFATNGFVNRGELEFESGHELVKDFELKPGKRRHFCSNCASPLFSSNDQDPKRVRLRLGILDSKITERPISHNFVTSKADWDSLNETLPHYEEHEPSRS